MNSLMTRVSSAGARKWNTRRTPRRLPGDVVDDMVCQVIIWPTRPAEPIPEPIALLSRCSTTVATGPRTAEARVGGTQISGWRTILGYLQHGRAQPLGQ